MTLSLELGAMQDANVRRAFEQIAQQYPLSPANALGAAPTTVATLPTGTQNGQDFYYRLSGGGVWHFKYDPASAKWDFAGGPPLFNEVVAAETTALTVYTALATAGPSITVPFAGDYEVAIGAGSWVDTAAVAANMSYDIGGTGAVDADSFRSRQNSAGNTGIAAGSRPRVKTGLAAATALVAKYKTAAGVGAFENRWMRVTPVRVG